MEWVKLVVDKFFNSKKHYFSEIDDDFDIELSEEINNIEIFSPYQEVEEKLQEFIRLIYKIHAVSIEIARSKKIPEIEETMVNMQKYGSDVIKDSKNIETQIELKEKDCSKIFKNYNLEFHFKSKVSSYIYNEILRGRNFEGRESQLEKAKNYIKSNNLLERDYNNTMKQDNNLYTKDYINSLEKKLDDLFEEKENLVYEKEVYENEMKIVKEDKTIKKGCFPLLLLFGFGVIVPLSFLLIDSLNSSLCNYFYIISYSITGIGIGFALLMILLYVRDHIKLEKFSNHKEK